MLTPLFAAFEAHIVNITATIENALLVPIDGIEFGAVFPQEELDRIFDLSLSDSFLAQNRVDGVEYVIRQKPKCVDNSDPTKHPQITEDNEGNFICPSGSTMMPLLCPYLSKHEISADGILGEDDDPGILPFHGLPGPWTLETTKKFQVFGVLLKVAGDTSDRWLIDLKVPCFRGSCAQDWVEFVETKSQSADINPSDYMADPALESEIFGCDLWLEITAIDPIRTLKLENKDESGNVIIDSREGTLTFGPSSHVFPYGLSVSGLAPNTSYSLIYFADPAPGNNPGAFLGSGVSDGAGSLQLIRSVDLGFDLPHPADANFPTGAKIQLVLSSDYDVPTRSMIASNPSEYLFETELITYHDTDDP